LGGVGERGGELGGELGGRELQRASGPLEVSVGVRDAVGVREFFGDERGSGELARVVVGVGARAVRR
jgi:hypothetical protein